jgi:hypothetical protein
MMARLWHVDGEVTKRHKGKGPHRRRLDAGGVDGVDGRLRRRLDTRGSAVTCVGRWRRGEHQCKGVGAVTGGAAKAAARQPYQQRAERGRAVTAARRSDTRGFGHMRSEWHGSAVTCAGKQRG